jgi:CheY-like chemotaxis protein
MRILLVEDSDAQRKALSRALLRMGHTVIGTPLATEGVRALTGPLRFDLILLDMMLAEEQTGWLLAYFRAFDRRSRRIPMIVLSGIPPEEVRFMSSQNVLHGVPIMSKPVELDLLEAEIAKLS